MSGYARGRVPFCLGVALGCGGRWKVKVDVGEVKEESRERAGDPGEIRDATRIASREKKSTDPTLHRFILSAKHSPLLSQHFLFAFFAESYYGYAGSASESTRTLSDESS